MILLVMQLLMGTSTSLYFPARGTAGLDRFTVRGRNLLPVPPPRIKPMTFMLPHCLTAARSGGMYEVVGGKISFVKDIYVGNVLLVSGVC